MPARAESMPYMQRDAPTQGGYREKRQPIRVAFFLAPTPPLVLVATRSLLAHSHAEPSFAPTPPRSACADPAVRLCQALDLYMENWTWITREVQIHSMVPSLWRHLYDRVRRLLLQPGLRMATWHSSCRFQ